jgi:hypothetical protein
MGWGRKRGEPHAPLDFWPLPELGRAGSFATGCWPLPVLGGVGSFATGWPLPVLAGAGLSGGWPLPALAGAGLCGTGWASPAGSADARAPRF